jgi:ribosomal-protein-alanine N-acetyltransferase
MIIETDNLQLIACDAELLRKAIAGDAMLANHLNVAVQENWTAFGVAALQYALERLSENEEESGWWTYFPVHKQDNQLIGSGGYKGKPTPEGIVEIGYEIAPDYRNRGLATEMAVGLIQHALEDERVQIIIAHTLGQENASTSVLHKCGFEKVEEINDPDDGPIWKWELKRQQLS